MDSFSADTNKAKTMTRRELFHIFRRHTHEDTGVSDTSTAQELQYSSTDDALHTPHDCISNDHDPTATAIADHSHAIQEEEEVPAYQFATLPPEFASLYRHQAEKDGLSVSADAMEEASSAFLKRLWEQCP